MLEVTLAVADGQLSPVGRYGDSIPETDRQIL